MNPLTARLTLALGILTVVPVTTYAESGEAQSKFERAYYLEKHDGNLAEAIELYRSVALDRSASRELMAEAETRRGSCAEDLRSQDMASLMPPDAIAFAEVRNPGQHIGNLARLIGVLGDPLANLTHPSGQAIPIPDGPGLVLPSEVFLSPAIVEELSRFRGVAVAVTGVEPPAPGAEPFTGIKAVAVLHPGDHHGIRGMIETAAQFVRPAEPINGFATIRIEPGVVVTFTNRLVIAATGRELIADVIDRIESFDRPSLAASDDLQFTAGRRADALVFAFVNVAKAVESSIPFVRGDRDAARGIGMARAMMDIDKMRSVCLSIGSNEQGLDAEFTMSLEEGHNNMVYNLVRTPPLNGRSLECVPAGAAAVLALGINPASDEAGREQALTKANTLQGITGLDLGRELFANIEEIAAFIVPGQRTGGEIPDVGLVITAADPQKSELLWTTLLSLPYKFAGEPMAEPVLRDIEGVPVNVYPMPEGGPSLHVAQVRNSLVIGLTEVAVKASIGAQRGGQSILKDEGVKAATDRMTEDTSIVLFAHAGRCAEIATQFCSEDEVAEVRQVAQIAGSTILTVTVDESPTRFRVSGNLGGLPQAKDAIRVFSQMMANHHERDRAAGLAEASAAVSE
jgi:hypothetical protein